MVGVILLILYTHLISTQPLIVAAFVRVSRVGKSLGGLDDWLVVAGKRIRSVLAKRRISYSSHFDIKIAEAGPNYMRAEPHIIYNALKVMERAGEVERYVSKTPLINAPVFYVPTDFKGAADYSRARNFIEWRKLFVESSGHSKYCGFVLEKMIFDSILSTNHYHILGSAPAYDAQGYLEKGKGSEILTYQGNDIYRADAGSGFDLFAIHKATDTPIGIEAKNLREWIYPASEEVWRAIARGCTLNCLPVIIARKISFIARVGFFAEFGLLGFETNFQYFDHNIQRDTNYRFKEKVVDKNHLGFADIKLIKSNATTPSHLVNFFDDTLNNYAEEYFEKFQKHKALLKKYAIDYKMAESSLNQSKRFSLYEQFKIEAAYQDILVPIE